MRKINYKKRFNLNKRKIWFMLVLIIFFNTSIMLNFFSARLGNVLLEATEKELRAITQIIINSHITRASLSKVGVDDLIIANKNNKDEITDIDFKLDVAYDMFFALKDQLDISLLALKEGKLPDNTIVIKDNFVIKVPFYAHTSNPLLMNLGPKLYVKVNMLEVIRGSVSTQVRNYGINTVLIDVFLNLFITESILLPTKRETIVLDYEVLLASKVIQGKVPSFYPGMFETNSGIINLE